MNEESKTFSSWYENYVGKSGLSFYGQGEEGSFIRQSHLFTNKEGNTKGASNSDVKWLRESIASGTDEEINDYIKRLQSEGYSKKELIRIKDHLIRERAGARERVVDNFIRKTSAEEMMDIFEFEGTEYGVLGGGFWAGNKPSIQGVSLETGEQVDIADMIFGKDKIIGEQSFNEAYEKLKNINWKESRSSKEVTEQVTERIKNNSKNTAHNQQTKKTHTTYKNKQQIPEDVQIKIDELTQQEYERFTKESRSDFKNKMNKIENDYNNQSEEIKNMSYSNEDDIVPYEWDTYDLNVSNSLIENADMPKESIDGFFNKLKNPGEKTHRKFTYNGTEFAIKNDLSFGEKGLTGKLVSLSNGEEFNASFILNNIDEAIKTGRYDVISELFDNIEISKTTMSSSDLLIESQRLKNEAKKTTQKKTSRREFNKIKNTTSTTNTKKEVSTSKTKTTGNVKKDIVNAVVNEVVEEAIETTVETAADTVDNAIEKIVEPSISQFGKTNNYGWNHEQVAQYAKDNFLSIEEAYERLDKLNEIEKGIGNSSYTINSANNVGIGSGTTILDSNGNPVNILPTDYGRNRTGYTVNQLGGMDAEGNFTYFDDKGNLVKAGMMDTNIKADDGSIITKVKKDTRPDGNIRKDSIKKPSKFWNQADDTIFSKGMRGFNVAANIVGTVATYKNARRQGHGVISSAARAGVDFAIGEALGMWAIPLELVKNVPTAAIKGTEMLYKENRRMNAAANNQAFSNAQFADNQQIATMRQTGLICSPV